MKRKLSIEGMRCSHCVSNLTDVLTEDIEGVEVLEVNLDGKYAIAVSYTHLTLPTNSRV